MAKKRMFPHVSDRILIKLLRDSILRIDTKINEIDLNFHDNVIDPFSALIEAAYHNLPYGKWKDLEKIRQVQKTLQNEIGYFHQQLIGHLNGWTDRGAGGKYDSENKKLKIIAEIKNKHNTFNSKSESATYSSMSRLLNGTKKKYNGYVVFIVPRSRKRYQRVFAPSGARKLPNLFKVDGATFYEIATGDPQALNKLYQALPTALMKAKKISKSNFKPELKKFMELFYLAYK